MNIINGDLYVAEDVISYSNIDITNLKKDDFWMEGDFRVEGCIYIGPYDSLNIKGKLYCTGDIIANDFIIKQK